MGSLPLSWWGIMRERRGSFNSDRLGAGSAGALHGVHYPLLMSPQYYCAVSEGFACVRVYFSLPSSFTSLERQRIAWCRGNMGDILGYVWTMYAQP